MLCYPPVVGHRTVQLLSKIQAKAGIHLKSKTEVLWTNYILFSFKKYQFVGWITQFLNYPLRVK